MSPENRPILFFFFFLMGNVPITVLSIQFGFQAVSPACSKVKRGFLTSFFNFYGIIQKLFII